MPYVSTRLGRWFYEERGAAARPSDPAIVLLHSVLVDGGMWRAQIPALAALGRVLVFDGPGHGRSESPPPFSLEDHADVLAEALRTLGVDRAIVLGLSWGGMVTMRLALRHPGLVAALGLLDTSAGVDSLPTRAKYRAFLAFGRRFGIPMAFARRAIAPIMFGKKSLDEHPELLTDFVRTLNGYPIEGVVQAGLAVFIRRTSILAKLRQIAAPTLVVCGFHDRATPPSHSEVIARAICGAELVFVTGSGHMSTLEQPARVTAILESFVARLLAH